MMESDPQVLSAGRWVKTSKETSIERGKYRFYTHMHRAWTPESLGCVQGFTQKGGENCGISNMN